MNRRLFVLAALALGGCATLGPPSKISTMQAPLAELEPIYSAQAGREALTIRVASRGCTMKGDFTFYVERRGDAVSLAFARRHVDVCKSLAEGATDLVFIWEELGLAARTPVVVLNPLVALKDRGA